VKLIQVDVVDLHPFQAGFATLDYVKSAVAEGVRFVGHSPVDLCRQKDVVAFAVPLQRFSHELFGGTTAIDVGGVEEVNAFTDRVVDDLAGVFKVGLLAEHHAAQNDGANVNTGSAEEVVFHGFLMLVT